MGEPLSPKTTRLIEKTAGYLGTTATFLLTTVIFLLASNLVLSLIFRFHDGAKSDWRNRVNPAAAKNGVTLKSLYPGLEEADIFRLRHETNLVLHLVYTPYIQFKEAPFAGQFIHVDENGIRSSVSQGPWPPDPTQTNIFLFGGSTTFGLGMPDDMTVASFLQEALEKASGRPVKIYNFACPYYYSTQERILLERLLAAGYVPDMTIFIDGLNEFHFPTDKPAMTRVLEEVNETRATSRLTSFVRTLAIYRAAISLKLSLPGRTAGPGRSSQDPVTNSSGELPDKNAENRITTIIERYRRNRKMIELLAAGYGVRSAFVWQPVPMYKYDLRFHFFAPRDFRETEDVDTGAGYVRAAELAKDNAWGQNFLWCADIQEGLKEPLYVDRTHYTARMSQRLAGCIASSLKETGLLPLRKDDPIRTNR